MWYEPTEPCQIERFARRIERERPLLCILAHGLRRCVDNAGADDVRPDLVGDDEYVVFRAERRELFYLPALPHAPGRVVRRAEHGGVNLILYDPPFHILKIHTPDAGFVLHERR